MPLSEIRELKADEGEMLWQAITAIEAQQLLMDIEAMTCIQLSKGRKTSGKSSRIHRRLHRQAFPWVEKKAISIDEFANMMGGRVG